jgi:hypothetical protein
MKPLCKKHRLQVRVALAVFFMAPALKHAAARQSTTVSPADLRWITQPSAISSDRLAEGEDSDSDSRLNGLFPTLPVRPEALPPIRYCGG